MKFQHCIFQIQQFKVLRNFENATFPLTSMMMLPKNVKLNNYSVSPKPLQILDLIEKK